MSGYGFYEGLEIKSNFTTWFERMKEYGFSEGNEFLPKMEKTSETGGRPAIDYDISVDMAKQICMIQRSESDKKSSIFHHHHSLKSQHHHPVKC